MTEKKRLFYLDNIRIVLTVLVVMHHAALAYGGEGLHPYKDPNPDFISPIIFSFFVGVNQAFFMSAFFFLSGYFTPRSLERKGVTTFLSERFIRLGIPILFYMLVLLQVNEWLLDVWLRGEAFTPSWGWEVGHLWFLQALLLFNLGYVLFKQFYTKVISFLPEQFPSKRLLWLSITVLGVLTFAVRIVYPVGETILCMQFAHFMHYIAAFCAGILAYRGNWLNHLSSAIGRYWGRVSAITIPVLAALGILAGILSNPAAAKKLLGGFTSFSFGYSIWESVVMVGLIVWLLYHFHAFHNATNNRLKWLSANAYAVYIIHQTVLVAVNVGLDGVSLLSSVKFVIALLIALPVCFGLSELIRRVPGTKPVLG